MSIITYTVWVDERRFIGDLRKWIDYLNSIRRNMNVQEGNGFLLDAELIDSDIKLEAHFDKEQKLQFAKLYRVNEIDDGADYTFLDLDDFKFFNERLTKIIKQRINLMSTYYFDAPDEGDQS